MGEISARAGSPQRDYSAQLRTPGNYTKPERKYHRRK